MGNKATIDKQRILDSAYRLASAEGLGMLNIRTVAQKCGISAGSIYNYFPTKGHLIAEVVGRFWRESIPSDLMRAEEGESFVDFCERLSRELHGIFGNFREHWLAQLSALDKKSIDTALKEEEAFFAHIRRGLKTALENDPAVNRDVFDESFTEESLCGFVWDAILTSLRWSKDRVDPLFPLMRSTLYR